MDRDRKTETERKKGRGGKESGIEWLSPDKSSPSKVVTSGRGLHMKDSDSRIVNLHLSNEKHHRNK